MDELEINREALKAVMLSPGGKYLIAHILEESKDGIEKFIDLPVDKKTSKAAYDMQAKYKVLKNLKEWIDSEIRMVE